MLMFNIAKNDESTYTSPDSATLSKRLLKICLSTKSKPAYYKTTINLTLLTDDVKKIKRRLSQRMSLLQV